MDTFKSSWQPCQLYIISHICLRCVCVGMCVRLDTNSSALNGLVVGNYLPPTHTWTPTCTQWFPSSGHAVICQPWSLWVAHGGVEAASRSDLWPGFTTGSRRFIPYLPTMPHYVRMMWWAWWTGGLRLDGSIPKQKLTWNKEAFLCSRRGNVYVWSFHSDRTTGLSCLPLFVLMIQVCFALQEMQWNNSHSRLVLSPCQILTLI